MAPLYVLAVRLPGTFFSFLGGGFYWILIFAFCDAST
jgi:hypothetical protein